MNGRIGPLMRRAALLLPLLTLGVGEAVAEPGLIGSWRGAGRAIETGGQSYRVKCQMSIERAGAKGYALQGKCSSAKGTQDGSGIVSRRGGNSFGGTLTGLTTGEKGRITLTLSGNRASALLKGPRGRLSVNLRRQ